MMPTFVRQANRSHGGPSIGWRAKNMLLLPWHGIGCDETYSTLMLTSKHIELAGHAYHQRCLFASGLHSQSPETDETDVDDDRDDDETLRSAWEAKHGKRKEIDDVDEEDLYDILGIAHIGFSASHQQIKKAYQKAILQHHPDKNGHGEDEFFKKIQHAWEILSDTQKRRGYDSQFAFDSSIPGPLLEPEEDFFAVFAPVFERNARFSIGKPVPPLGDDKSSQSKVKQFYAFWTSFQSWREFSKYDEFKDGDIEHASSRMERRWMNRQNEIQRTKRKKKEYERIQRLVQRAKDNDPRLARWAAKEKAEKEAAYLAKKEEEERLQREKEERERREEEERLEKEAQEKAHAAKIKEERTRIRLVFRETKQNLESQVDSVEDVALRGKLHGALYTICNHHHLDADALKPVLDMLIAKKYESVIQYETNIIDSRNEERLAKEEEAAKAKALEEQERIERQQINKAPWTNQEISALAKAMKKFPGGSKNRWLLVSQYINALPGQTSERSPDDCIAQSRVKINIGANSAFENFKTDLGAAKDTSEDAKNNEEIWSQEQQGALEAALKKYPATMDKNERWKAIAKDVPGKTKKDCVARFKFLRESIQNKQSVSSSK